MHTIKHQVLNTKHQVLYSELEMYCIVVTETENPISEGNKTDRSRVSIVITLLFITRYYYFRTLARSLEPVVTECKEHTIRTQTKTNG